MSWRQLRFIAGLTCAASLGSGCASLPFLHRSDTTAATTAAAAPQEHAVYQLEVDAPRGVHDLLATYLDLARFQKMPANDSITVAELDRLIAAAPAQARSLLETEGYFNAQVHVNRLDADSGETGAMRVRVAVEPGPRAVISGWMVDLSGPLQTAAQADDEAAVVEVASLRRRWPLKDGEPFRQAAWTDAKNLTLARLRAEGYPAARWASTQARVDADKHTVQLQVVADSGPLFKLGALKIEGLQRYDEESVRNLATFHAGQPYTEQLLLDFQDRLLKSGLFEGAVVELGADDPARADAAPVTVRLKELPLQTATIGLGYSANTGQRITLEHWHRKPFGERWIADDKFSLGPTLKSWDGQLTSHPKPDMYRNLVAGTYERLAAADQVRLSWTARVGRTQDKQRIERLYYAEFTHSRLDTSAGVASSDAASLNYQWTLRDVDSVLLPTKGSTLSTQTAVGLARGREITDAGITNGQGPFGRGYVRLTWYRPLPSNWYATLRTEAGEVFAQDRVSVPDPLLFRAGGEDSVRGYAYRTLGPMVDGTVTSGRMLWTGSAEVARPISAKLPQFWWATFIDAGNAANRWSELHPAWGYGTGLRWRSPVGPLKLDLSYGQDVRRWRVDMSVGVTF